MANNSFNDGNQSLMFNILASKMDIVASIYKGSRTTPSHLPDSRLMENSLQISKMHSEQTIILKIMQQTNKFYSFLLLLFKSS